MSKFEEYIKEYYVTEEELGQIMDVSPERLRDLRSHHVQGKQKFIDFTKLSHKRVVYHFSNVIEWLNDQPTNSFGINRDDPDKEVSD